MRDRFGVIILNFDDIKSQLTAPNEIGVGGFGSVYRCRISELGNTNYFAVKRLDHSKQMQLSQEESLGSREFFRELEVLAPCRHPNIVRVVAVCVHTSELILVYPYVDGGDLEQRLESKANPLSSDERVRIALQILDAVIYLHTPMLDKPCILHRCV
jgi:serine/threonine protein kinase